MIWVVVGALLTISFIWALLSLRSELAQPKNVEARRKLQKERVLFQK